MVERVFEMTMSEEEEDFRNRVLRGIASIGPVKIRNGTIVTTIAVFTAMFIMRLPAQSAAQAGVLQEELWRTQQQVLDLQAQQMNSIQVQQPKYALWEGVGVAIQSVMKRGESLSKISVMKELQAMASRSEVELPVTSTSPRVESVTISSSGKAKIRRRQLSLQEKRALNDRKREFESQIERYIANVAAKAGISYEANVAAGVVIEPTPDGFLSKDHFVKAYVAYKMQTVDSEIRDKYSRKIGGLGDYRRDMRREASALWNLVKGGR